MLLMVFGRGTIPLITVLSHALIFVGFEDITFDWRKLANFFYLQLSPHVWGGHLGVKSHVSQLAHIISHITVDTPVTRP